MKTEIIAVGTELLLGQTVNTNATYISDKLALIGYEVFYQSVVGDNPARLTEALNIACRRSELVILCGGLGPTEDDLTKEVVAEFLGLSLEMDQVALAKIKNRFSQLNRELTPNNLKQAQYIGTGEIIENGRGLAVGSLVSGQGVNYLLLPGPPSELEFMMTSQVLPKLQEMAPTSDRLTSVLLRFYGIGEATLASRLTNIISEQSNPTIALYAKDNEVTVRLTAKGSSDEKNKKLLKPIHDQILGLCRDYFYGYGEDNDLYTETSKALPNTSQTIQIIDYFTEGRLGNAWQMTNLNHDITNKSYSVLSPALKEVVGNITPQQLNEQHATRVFGDTVDLSVLLIGQLKPIEKTSSFGGEIMMSIYLHSQYFNHTAKLSGNSDTIKERASLETTNFIKGLLRNEQKGNKHS